MKTNLSFANPSEVETECLAVVVLDHGSKDKSEVSVETSDSAIKDVTSDLMATGEVTGKIFETTLLHRPAKLKAKRLLLLAGGKVKNFTASELRKLAGAAARDRDDGVDYKFGQSKLPSPGLDPGVHVFIGKR